ncbi:MAG: hypothetical protein ABH803_01580 [Candidatus Micrarchaeota archaeon]
MKKNTLKLTAFDKKLYTLVSSGVTKKKTILDSLVLDETEFDKRVKTLMRNKLFVYSNENQDLKLGVKAFDYFKERAPKKKRVIEEKTVEFPLPASVFVEEPEKKEELDLGQLLAEGAPREKIMQKTLSEEKVLVISSPQHMSSVLNSGKPLMTQGKEACELCKGAFKLNVKNLSESKYGHCFCGAGFHTDCYNALLNQDGRCVRCGRKLELILDKKSEETLHGLKGVFD